VKWGNNILFYSFGYFTALDILQLWIFYSFGYFIISENAYLCKKIDFFYINNIIL
jgi:hypothetical protein